MSSDSFQHKKIDHELLPFLSKLIFEEYHLFSPSDRATQKHDFLQSSQVAFTYSRLKQFSLEVYQEELYLMQKKTASSNIPNAVKTLYLEKFLEQQKILTLLKATKSGDDIAFYKASCDS